jgi:TRAP-type C4-dicarboxylate transport system permease small subunit
MASRRQTIRNNQKAPNQSGPGYKTSAFDRVLTWLHMAGSGLIMALMLVIVCDVLGRALFNKPLTGAAELIRAAVVAVLFLGLPKTFRSGKQIRATLLLNKVSSRAAGALDLLACIAGILLFALLVYSGWDLLVEAWRVGEFEGAGALRVPTTPLRALIVISAMLTLVQLIIQALKSWARMWKKGG